jgi:Fe-S-cluster-containing dehydrogenase component
MAACAKEAIIKDEETGWIKVNSMKCVGCKDCIFACPLSLPKFDEERRAVFVCDFCDGEPVCAKYCSPRALRIVSRAEAWELNKKAYTKKGA